MALQDVARSIVTLPFKLGRAFFQLARRTVNTTCRAIIQVFVKAIYLAVFTVAYLVLRLGVLKGLISAFQAYRSLQAGLHRSLLRLATFRAGEYSYRPINRGDSEIRLLKLQSVDPVWGIPRLKLVKADLISVPIASAPPFAAVSYRWTYSNSLPILLGGKSFAASGSICELLGALTSGSPGRPPQEQFLWIDSICINQADNGEKAWQIGLMRDVYRSATHVVGWLGADSPPVGTWRGIDGVREAAEVASNDFFFRAWIIQEVSLAKNMIMHSPEDSCPWGEGFFQTLRQSGDSISLYGENQFGLPSHVMPRLADGIRNMNSMESFRVSLEENPDGLPLSELLVRSAEFQCTDPRDRVYGLLGLTTDSARSNIIVDYGHTNGEVDTTMQAARFAITAESSFQLLELSGLSTGQSRRQGPSARPSWIPAWQTSHVLQMKPILSHSRSFGAATFLAPKIEPSGQDANGDRTLRIEGAIVDRVQRMVTTAWDLPDTCDFRDQTKLAQLTSFLDTLDMVSEIARGDRPLTGGDIQDLHDTIVRTIMQEGSQMREGKALQELRLDMEQISGNLRRMLKAEIGRHQRSSIHEMNLRHFIMGFEEFMPLVVGRKLCITRQGRLAIVPASAEVGDDICVFSGAPSPFVITRTCGGEEVNGDGYDERSGTYQLIGPCYADGIMRGELREADLELGSIGLV